MSLNQTDQNVHCAALLNLRMYLHNLTGQHVVLLSLRMALNLIYTVLQCLKSSVSKSDRKICAALLKLRTRLQFLQT